MRVPSFVKTNDDWDLQIVASLCRLHRSVRCHCSTARHAALQYWTLVTVTTLPLVVTMNAAAVDMVVGGLLCAAVRAPSCSVRVTPAPSSPCLLGPLAMVAGCRDTGHSHRQWTAFSPKWLLTDWSIDYNLNMNSLMLVPYRPGLGRAGSQAANKTKWQEIKSIIGECWLCDEISHLCVY